jgi:ATP-dependent DNA helicase RecG
VSKPWQKAIPDLKSEAIDFRAASELFAPYRQLTAQAWSTLRVTTEHQGGRVPTIGGLLLFGKDRFARFPDAWIQAGRFAGINRARLLDSAEIRSFLPRAAEEAIAFIHKHLGSGVFSISTGLTVAPRVCRYLGYAQAHA